jgi:DNA invertase Pin-like site-specific DNA recombinase
MTDSYGYIRCSGLGQMDGEGPDRQQETIGTFAAGHDFNIADWYIESHTGSDLEGRPQFSSMRAAMVSNGVHCVIVEKLDRLARSVLVQETIIADFKENGILLVSATPGEEDLCGDDPTRVVIRQILAAFFEYERKMIVSKLKDARDRIKREGRKPGQKNYSLDPIRNHRAEGRKPYGEHPDYPEERAVVARMIVLRAEGNRPDQIAQILNSEGVETRGTRNGKAPWHPSTISKILARHKEK